MPPHTPELNSIEALWSVIKRNFKQAAEAHNHVRMQQEEFEELLQACLDEVTPLQQSNAALKNNRHYLHQCLDDLIQLKRLEQGGLAPGAEPKEPSSDGDGTSTFNARWPPMDDPPASSRPEHSIQHRAQLHQPLSPRADQPRSLIFDRRLIGVLT